MNQKRALVVGASSGIGLGVAQKLASRGQEVYCIARRTCPDSRVKSFCADVTAETFGEALGSVLADGAVNTLVYSAGFSMAAPVETAKPQDYRYLFDVDFFGAVQAVQAVLPGMRELGGGRIVLIASVGGVLPIAFDAFYSASKAALITFCKELNLETEPYGVRATAVLPGGTATRFTYKRKVYPATDAGVYAEELTRSVAALADIEQGGMRSTAVADTVIDVLAHKNPPAVVASGALNKAYVLSQKVLPDRLTSYFLKKTYLNH